MASGANHIKGTLLIVLPAGLFGLVGGGGAAGGIACAAGCLAGIILSPDLDVEHRTESEYLIYRWLGKFLGAVWFAFWWLYGKVIPHRHFISHFPVIGTLGRIAYIYLLGGVLWYGSTVLVTGSGAWLPLMAWLANPTFSWGVVGLILADTLHYIMDVLPFWRQSRRPWWQKLLRNMLR